MFRKKLRGCNEGQNWTSRTVIIHIYTDIHTAISIKVVPEQSGKVEYERERLLGIAKKLTNFLAIPSNLSRSYSTFPLRSGTTLIEIAVCTAHAYVT
jgi:hypothetical protein